MIGFEESYKSLTAASDCFLLPQVIEILLPQVIESYYRNWRLSRMRRDDFELLKLDRYSSFEFSAECSYGLGGPRLKSEHTCRYPAMLSSLFFPKQCGHTKGVLTVIVKARGSFEVVAVASGIFPVNFHTKWLLWHVHVHVDCAGSHKSRNLESCTDILPRDLS